MNTRYRFYVACMLLLVTPCWLGCGGGKAKPPGPLPPPTALTLEQWKTLPIEEKYDGATLERLKLGNPQLHHNRSWQMYERQYILPERAKDIPVPPGQQPP